MEFELGLLLIQYSSFSMDMSPSGHASTGHTKTFTQQRLHLMELEEDREITTIFITCVRMAYHQSKILYIRANTFV